jgi:S1-C subfamily serine protease
VGTDPSTDIALLRLKNSYVSAAEFSDSAKVRVGQFVLIVGRRTRVWSHPTEL